MTALPGVISYPIPAYQNVPIHTEFYKPQRFVISAVTLGKSTLVTTTVNNDYVIGQEVRLIIPPTFGCRQLNEVSGFVLSIPNPNQVILNIDSSKNVDPFFASSSTTVLPQILAIGDVNTGYIDNIYGNKRTGTYIPGSFINISPN